MHKAISCWPEFVVRVVLVIVLTGSLSLAGGSGFAAAGEVQRPDADASNDDEENNATPADSAEQPGSEKSEKKEQVATAAVLLLGMVLFIGLALVIWVMLLGGRVRRLARRRLPESTGGDELWYLRPKKHVPTGHPGQDAAGNSADDGEPTGDSDDREAGAP